MYAAATAPLLSRICGSAPLTYHSARARISPRAAAAKQTRRGIASSPRSPARLRQRCRGNAPRITRHTRCRAHQRILCHTAAATHLPLCCTCAARPASPPPRTASYLSSTLLSRSVTHAFTAPRVMARNSGISIFARNGGMVAAWRQQRNVSIISMANIAGVTSAWLAAA